MSSTFIWSNSFYEFQFCDINANVFRIKLESNFSAQSKQSKEAEKGFPSLHGDLAQGLAVCHQFLLCVTRIPCFSSSSKHAAVLPCASTCSEGLTACISQMTDVYSTEMQHMHKMLSSSTYKTMRTVAKYKRNWYVTSAGLLQKLPKSVLAAIFLTV
eukprot:1143257-Pelagomonas_calceolata.AAC.1